MSSGSLLSTARSFPTLSMSLSRPNADSTKVRVFRSPSRSSTLSIFFAAALKSSMAAVTVALFANAVRAAT